MVRITSGGVDTDYPDGIFRAPLDDGIVRAVSSSVLTRRANTTAYATGQLVGGSATVGFAGNGFTFANFGQTPGSLVKLDRLRLYKSQSTALGSFEVRLFRAQPTITIADAGVVATGTPVGNATDNARLIARFAFAFTGAALGSDGAELAAVPMIGSSILAQLPAGGTDLFALLVATGAYTPTSGETFSMVLEGEGF